MVRQFFFGLGLLYEFPPSHAVGLLWTGDRPLPDNTQHSQETDITVPSGIRTHNAGKRETVDPCLRPHDH